MARTLVPKEDVQEEIKLDLKALEFRAKVIELHQPVEQMGNQKTLTEQKSEMIRLENGDWLVQSKKTKEYYLVGGGNVKAARLKSFIKQ